MPNSTDSTVNQDVQAIWAAGVAAVDAGKLVRDFVVLTSSHIRFGSIDDGCEFELASFNRVVVVGAGKASGWMAAGLEQALGADFLSHKQVHGRVNVPDDQWVATRAIEIFRCRAAGSNLPTERVLNSTAKILEAVARCHPNDLCICLLSGGGSALLEQPIESISLDDIRVITQLLSGAGATIDELNTIRRQISRVKAGGLARAASCRKFVTLIVSDVIGDRLDMIASGPTVIESLDSKQTRHQIDALKIVEQRCPGLAGVPQTVVDVLTSRRIEFDIDFKIENRNVVHHFVIGNNEAAVRAAAEKANSFGYQCHAKTESADGDANIVGQRLAQQLLQLESKNKPASSQCFIFGGEPTVELSTTPGLGGRNQQLVLAALLELLKSETNFKMKFGLLSGGTDGEDGNTAVAGAFFDSRLLNQLRPLDMCDRIKQHLTNNASYTFLQELGCLLKVPATRTNVCDLRVVVCRFDPE